MLYTLRGPQVWDLRQKRPVISFTDSATRTSRSCLAWNPDVATQARMRRTLSARWPVLRYRAQRKARVVIPSDCVCGLGAGDCGVRR